MGLALRRKRNKGRRRKRQQQEKTAEGGCVPLERSSEGKDPGLASLLLLADLTHIGVSSLDLSHSVDSRVTSQISS